MKTTAATPIWKASLETRHFTFEVIATSEAKAYAALKAGWKAHVAQCQPTCEVEMYSWDDICGDVSMEEFVLDVCFRDGSRIGTA